MAHGRKKAGRSVSRSRRPDGNTDSGKTIPKRNRRLLLVVILVAVGAGALLSFFGRRKPGNLIVITLDTVRADRLGCYGYKDIATPNIDMVARNGILFENAIAAAPITLPSHTTLFTGLYPPGHGVRDNTTFRLSSGAVTLAEVLHSKGFTTGAVVGAFVLDSIYGLDQGFSFYDDEFEGATSLDDGGTAHLGADMVRLRTISQRRAGMVTDRALSWLRRHGNERFFLWIHYFDPHCPYTPPPTILARYPDRPYDGEIAYVDENVGVILTSLKDLGLREETLIVIAGDHGESLGDHGESTHSLFLYESTLRVPLIMSYPSHLPRGRRYGHPVSLADVMPTVLELLDIKPPPGLDGVSLTGISDSIPGQERVVYSETMLPYLNYGWSEERSVRDSRWKYVHTTDPELYRIDKDPNEMENLRDDEPTVAAHYDSILNSIVGERMSRGDGLAEDAGLTTVDRERLLALGYASSSPPPEGTASLKDPKEMITYHELINRGYEAMDRGDAEKALDIFLNVIAGDPTNATAYNLSGMLFIQLGDTIRSREAFQKSIELNPNLANAHYNLGNIAFIEKKYRLAVSRYEKAVELNPWAGNYCAALARSYALAGDDRRAKETYELALALGISSQELLLEYGRTLTRLGMFMTAEKQFEEVIRMDPANAEAHYLLGNLYLNTRNTPLARDQLRKVLELGSDDPALQEEARVLLGKTSSRDSVVSPLYP